MGLLGKIGAGLGAVFAPTTMLGTGLSLGSSALDYLSAQKQNKSAETMAKDSMAFSASQSAQQMAFQERMSGTAHQREVSDLKAAGLNPLLSVNSGASSPAGASGTGAQAPVVPELSAFTNSARDNLSMMNEFANSKAQRKLIGESTRDASGKADLSQLEASYARKNPNAYFMSRYGSVDTATARALDWFMEKMRGTKVKPYTGREDTNWRRLDIGK